MPYAKYKKTVVFEKGHLRYIIALLESQYRTTRDVKEKRRLASILKKFED